MIQREDAAVHVYRHGQRYLLSQATVEEGDVHHSVIGQVAYEESSESEQVTRQCKETLVTAGESDDSERGCSGPLVQILQKVFVINNEVFREKPVDQVTDEESVGTGVENRQKKKEQREPVFSSWLGGWTIDHLQSRQGGDPTIAKILEWKKTNNVRPEWTIDLDEDKLVKSFWTQWDRLEVMDGVLYRRWESTDGLYIRWQMVLPKSMVEDVFRLLREVPTAGHLGVYRTIASVRLRFYWSCYRSDVTRLLKQCDACQSRKSSAQQKTQLGQ